MAEKQKKNTVEEKIFRMTEETLEEKSLYAKLHSGKKLRIKLGADPTTPNLHLGHVLALKKLREFQDEGHIAIFIIGDYTARLGDPSGRSKTRPPLSTKDIEKNAKTYFSQAGKILNVGLAEIHYNSEWFSSMKLEEFLRIAGNFSAARLMDREDFQKRLLRGEEVAYHETLYQIMQAYDSVAVRADVEIGGRDQKLNLLAGRELQRKMGIPEQDCLIVPLLVGTDGKEKMSKSIGNTIDLADSPDEMYGKVMSIPDTLTADYFRLLFDESSESKNPRDEKMRLAKHIVTMCHGSVLAEKAEKRFVDVFQKKKSPDDLLIINVAPKTTILDFLKNVHNARSGSEARRLLEGGGVKIHDTVVMDEKTVFLREHDGAIVKIGKRHFYRIRVQ